jgi:predicted RNA-binding Zn-ribbon protein involved in translation (DUF1610 family)
MELKYYTATAGSEDTLHKVKVKSSSEAIHFIEGLLIYSIQVKSAWVKQGNLSSKIFPSHSFPLLTVQSTTQVQPKNRIFTCPNCGWKSNLLSIKCSLQCPDYDQKREIFTAPIGLFLTPRIPKS